MNDADIERRIFELKTLWPELNGDLLRRQILDLYKSAEKCPTPTVYVEAWLNELYEAAARGEPMPPMPWDADARMRMERFVALCKSAHASFMTAAEVAEAFSRCGARIKKVSRRLLAQPHPPGV